jgi:hypothetical protein
MFKVGAHGANVIVVSQLVNAALQQEFCELFSQSFSTTTLTQDLDEATRLESLMQRRAIQISESLTSGSAGKYFATIVPVAGEYYHVQHYRELPIGRSASGLKILPEPTCFSLPIEMNGRPSTSENAALASKLHFAVAHLSADGSRPQPLLKSGVLTDVVPVAQSVDGRTVGISESRVCFADSAFSAVAPTSYVDVKNISDVFFFIKDDSLRPMLRDYRKYFEEFGLTFDLKKIGKWSTARMTLHGRVLAAGVGNNLDEALVQLARNYRVANLPSYTTSRAQAPLPTLEEEEADPDSDDDLFESIASTKMPNLEVTLGSSRAPSSVGSSVSAVDSLSIQDLQGLVEQAVASQLKARQSSHNSASEDHARLVEVGERLDSALVSLDAIRRELLTLRAMLPSTRSQQFKPRQGGMNSGW